MPKLPLALTLFALSLAACGFKGDLYLPKENDKNKFGVIQTGIDFRRSASEPAAPAANPNDFIRTPSDPQPESTQHEQH
ncbi:LPS translocon maturation chaperone LptM [Kingella oralis]|uniref:LPS translocon maturation chaperone LptM n=1 Tax=Kingella oralis TaxID=505 RepID=UPI0034E40E78